MKFLLSTKFTNASLNVALLLLRLAFAGLMIPHGYSKLVRFGGMREKFMNFLGMGGTLSLSLTVFAEFFCAIFVLLGLFTRLTLLPLIIAMAVAVFKAHNAEIFGDGGEATLFLAAYMALFLAGPGKFSIDGAMGR